MIESTRLKNLLHEKKIYMKRIENGDKSKQTQTRLNTVLKRIESYFNSLKYLKDCFYKLKELKNDNETTTKEYKNLLDSFQRNIRDFQKNWDDAYTENQRNFASFDWFERFYYHGIPQYSEVDPQAQKKAMLKISHPELFRRDEEYKSTIRTGYDATMRDMMKPDKPRKSLVAV